MKIALVCIGLTIGQFGYSIDLPSMFNVPVNNSQVTVDSITKESYISPGAQWAVLSINKPEFFVINKTTGAVHNMPSAVQILSSINLELGSSATINDERKEIMQAALQAMSEATGIALFVLSIQAAYEDATTQASAAFTRDQLIQGLNQQKANIQITQSRVNAINPKSYVSWMFGSSTPSKAKSSTNNRMSVSFDENSDTISIPAALMESIIQSNDYKQKSDVTIAANLLFKQCFIAQQQHRADAIPLNVTKPLSAENYIYNNFPNIYVKYNNKYPICEKAQALGVNARVPLLHIRQAIQTALSIANQKSASNFGSFLPQYLTSYLDGVVSELMKYDNHLSELCKNPGYGATPTDIAKSTEWSTMSKVAGGLAVVGTLAAAYYFRNEIGDAGQKSYDQTAQTASWLTGKTAQLEKDKATAEKLAVDTEKLAIAKAAADQKVIDDKKMITAQLVAEESRLIAKNEADRLDENARRSNEAKLAEKTELSPEQEKAIEEFVENPVTFTKENVIPLVNAVGGPAVEAIKINAPIIAEQIKENAAPVIKSIKENAPIVAEQIKENATFAKDVAVALSTNPEQGPAPQPENMITPAPIKTKEQIHKDQVSATAESLKKSAAKLGESANNAKEKLAGWVGYETEKAKKDKADAAAKQTPQEKAAAAAEAAKPKRVFGAAGLTTAIDESTEHGAEEYRQEIENSTNQALIDKAKMKKSYYPISAKTYKTNEINALNAEETMKSQALEAEKQSKSAKELLKIEQEKLEIATNNKKNLDAKIKREEIKLAAFENIAEIKNTGRTWDEYFAGKKPSEQIEANKTREDLETLRRNQQFTDSNFHTQTNNVSEKQIEATTAKEKATKAQSNVNIASEAAFQAKRLALLAKEVEDEKIADKINENKANLIKNQRIIANANAEAKPSISNELRDRYQQIQKKLNPENLEFTGKGLNAYNKEMEDENDVSHVGQLENYDIEMDKYNPYNPLAKKPEYPMASKSTPTTKPTVTPAQSATPQESDSAQQNWDSNLGMD